MRIESSVFESQGLRVWCFHLKTTDLGVLGKHMQLWNNCLDIGSIPKNRNSYTPQSPTPAGLRLLKWKYHTHFSLASGELKARNTYGYRVTVRRSKP
mgnify:CR=1 FL=1